MAMMTIQRAREEYGGAGPVFPQESDDDIVRRILEGSPEEPKEPKEPTYNLPVGFAVNPSSGALYIPGGLGVRPGNVVGIGELFDAGDTVYRWNGRTITKATVAESRDYWDSYGVGAGGDGAAGGGGTESGYLSLAQQKFAYDKLRDLVGDQEAARLFRFEQEQADRAELARRGSAGLSLADLARGLANDQFERAADPGNYPALLAGYAGREAGAGPPLTSLLGAGFRITPPEGGNPLADPRFQNLLSSLYGYGTVPSAPDVTRVRDAVNAGATLQGFQNFADFDRARGLREGGTMTTRGPAYLIDGRSGEVLAEIGEEGRERIDVTPLRKLARGGTIDVESALRPEERGETKARTISAPATLSSLREGFLPSPLPGETAIGRTFAGLPQPVGGTPPYVPAGPGLPGPAPLAPGGEYSPAQGTAIALAKALRPLGFAPPEVIASLEAGQAPVPGSVSDRFLYLLKNRAPSLWLLLQAQIKSQLGRAGLLDYLAQREEFQTSGFNQLGGVRR